MTQVLRQWSAWLRIGAASAALFAMLGVGHVLPALHFALVAHRVCAEHGELVHEAAPALANTASPTQVSLVAGAAAKHEHEHCGVLALPGSFAAAGSSSPVFHLAAHAGAAIVPGRALPAHVGIDLLAYAPKLAPPEPAAVRA